MCKLVVGVCFLGWDLWLWALDVCVGDWSWPGVDWSVELLLAGGRHCWRSGRPAEIYSCGSRQHRERAEACESPENTKQLYLLSFELRDSTKTQFCLSQQILRSLVLYVSRISHFYCSIIVAVLNIHSHYSQNPVLPSSQGDVISRHLGTCGIKLVSNISLSLFLVSVQLQLK